MRAESWTGCTVAKAKRAVKKQSRKLTKKQRSATSHDETETKQAPQTIVDRAEAVASHHLIEAERRTRRGKFTDEKRAEVLELYQTGVTLRQACEAVGISSVAFFNHVRKDPEFAKQYAAAQEANTDALEDRLHGMALAGNVAALFGTLKSRRPHKWRDRSQVDLTNSDGSFKAFAAGMQQGAKELDRELRSEEPASTH